jgi:hypothetical protein
MQAQASGSLSALLTSTPDGAPVAFGASPRQGLDLGAVSAAGARNANVYVARRLDGFVVQTKFGLIIQDQAHRLPSATVLASLAYADGVYTFWVDGVKLTTTPQIIQGLAKVGPVQAHRLEIQVPGSVTENNSQINAAIIFQIVPN